MGLILCENKRAKNPLYIESLGIRLYTLEELCYVIYNYPLLIIKNFVNERLFSFLVYDLDIGLNALLLERRSKENEYDADVLISILSFSDYYSTQEIEKYKAVLNQFFELPRFELYDRIGRAYFENGSFGKALDFFNKSLAYSEGLKIENEKPLKIKLHKADAYANLFEFTKAFELYKEIFEANQDNEILKKIYFLSKFDNNVSNREDYINYLDDRVNGSWDNSFQELMDSAAECDESKEFLQSMNSDSFKRQKLINENINRIKIKYRTMV